jgi:hypothetical protein
MTVRGRCGICGGDSGPIAVGIVGPTGTSADPSDFPGIGRIPQRIELGPDAVEQSHRDPITCILHLSARILALENRAKLWA